MSRVLGKGGIKEMFEQATRILTSRLEGKPLYEETIQQFLREFATHVLWNSMPANGSTILEFQGLTIDEIAKILPDMSQEKEEAEIFDAIDVAWQASDEERKRVYALFLQKLEARKGKS
jgi:hypothetical protein